VHSYVLLIIAIDANSDFLIDMAAYPGYSGTSYEPLPLTTEEQSSTFPPYQYHLQSPSSHDLIAQDANSSPAFDIPSGAAQPRFMGAALYSDQHDPRHSYASSQSSFPMSPSVYNSSVYALDPSSGAMGYTDDPRSSYQPEQYGMAPMSPADRSRFLEEKNVAYASPRAKTKCNMRTWIIIAGLGLLLLVAAVVVYFLAIKPRMQTSSDSSSSTTATTTSTAGKAASTAKTNLAITGGDGSTVTMDDGSTFVYRNSFGGYWYYDKNDPFNNGARAQSWTPALNETFNYGTDQIRG
jgi:glucan 1,3-beta-glucosidase